MLCMPNLLFPPLIFLKYKQGIPSLETMLILYQQHRERSGVDLEICLFSKLSPKFCLCYSHSLTLLVISMLGDAIGYWMLSLVLWCVQGLAKDRNGKVPKLWWSLVIFHENWTYVYCSVIIFEKWTDVLIQGQNVSKTKSFLFLNGNWIFFWQAQYLQIYKNDYYKLK